MSNQIPAAEAARLWRFARAARANNTGPRADARTADQEEAPIQEGLGVRTWAGPWSWSGRRNSQERLLHRRARGPAFLENRASWTSLSSPNLVAS